MIVLDTHVWWWVTSEPVHLSSAVRELMEQTPREEVRIPSISLWELSLLFHKQRILLTTSPEEWFRKALQLTGFQLEPLSPEVALGAYQLPGDFHPDPADRLIVSTARHLNAVLVTKDEKIRAYPHVRSFWD